MKKAATRFSTSTPPGWWYAGHCCLPVLQVALTCVQLVPILGRFFAGAQHVDR